MTVVIEQDITTYWKDCPCYWCVSRYDLYESCSKKKRQLV